MAFIPSCLLIIFSLKVFLGVYIWGIGHTWHKYSSDFKGLFMSGTNIYLAVTWTKCFFFWCFIAANFVVHFLLQYSQLYSWIFLFHFHNYSLRHFTSWLLRHSLLLKHFLHLEQMPLSSCFLCISFTCLFRFLLFESDWGHSVQIFGSPCTFMIWFRSLVLLLNTFSHWGWWSSSEPAIGAEEGQGGDRCVQDLWLFKQEHYVGTPLHHQQHPDLRQDSFGDYLSVVENSLLFSTWMVVELVALMESMEGMVDRVSMDSFTMDTAMMM